MQAEKSAAAKITRVGMGAAQTAGLKGSGEKTAIDVEWVPLQINTAESVQSEKEFQKLSQFKQLPAQIPTEEETHKK